MAARSGVAVGTLRMWEARYGFPAPERLPSGHRRYSEHQLEQLVAVVKGRDAGLPLGMAIERSRRLSEEPRPSVYGALRARFPHLHPQLVTKPVLVRICRAIEDECSARARRPVFFGCFQHERFYRASQARWRQLARSAEIALVLADFERVSHPPGGPVEVPIRPDDALMGEWVLVCDAPELPACLIGWERPGKLRPRRFETIWTVEPEVVREAARICCALAGRSRPELVADVRERLAERPAAAGGTHLRAAVELATRMTIYAVEPGP